MIELQNDWEAMIMILKQNDFAEGVCGKMIELQND